MIRAARTITYPAPDLAASKAWYTTVLGVAPYFDEPFYVGFSLRGVEIGLVPDATPSATGEHLYWSVADAAAALEWLNGLGAPTHSGVTDVGGGIRVASVLDPAGNVFGVISEPETPGGHG